MFAHDASSLHSCHNVDNAKLERFNKFSALVWLAALVAAVFAVLIVLLHVALDWSITLWFSTLNLCRWSSICALNWLIVDSLCALASLTAMVLFAFCAATLFCSAAVNCFIASVLSALLWFISFAKLEKNWSVCCWLVALNCNDALVAAWSDNKVFCLKLIFCNLVCWSLLRLDTSSLKYASAFVSAACCLLFKLAKIISLYDAASAAAIGVAAFKIPSAIASANIVLWLSPRFASAAMVALDAPLAQGGSCPPVCKAVSISVDSLPSWPFTVASDVNASVSAAIVCVGAVSCAATACGVLAPVVVAVYVCAVAAGWDAIWDADTLPGAAIVGAVVVVGVAASTVPVTPGVDTVSPACTFCNAGFTVVPWGSVGWLTAVCKTPATFAAPPCAVVACSGNFTVTFLCSISWVAIIFSSLVLYIS